MPIVAADLKQWLPVNNPEDDTTIVGGNIQDTAHASGGISPTFTPLAAADALEVVSSAGDTRNITVTGRDATGAIISDTKAINGTTVVPITGTFERLLKAVLDSKHATHIVTLRRTGVGATVATLGANVLAIRRMFYDAASDAVSTKSLYELVYWKNEHGTLTLNSATVEFISHPAEPTTVQIALHTAKGNVPTEPDRTTAPGGLTFVDDGTAPVAVPGNSLTAGQYIGVWIRVDLAAGNAAFKGSVQTKLAGTSV